MASHRAVCGAVVMVTVMLVFMQGSAAQGERRRSSSSPRSRSPSSSSSSHRSSNRGRGSNSGSSAGQRLPYYMMCPEVRCPPLPSDCQAIESFIYTNQHEVPGQGLVTISCPSCEYCLDIPHYVGTRGVRNYDNEQALREMTPCSLASCPPQPDNDCIDVRLTNILVNGEQCKQCLSCFDNLL